MHSVRKLRISYYIDHKTNERERMNENKQKDFGIF